MLHCWCLAVTRSVVRETVARQVGDCRCSCLDCSRMVVMLMLVSALSLRCASCIVTCRPVLRMCGFSQPLALLPLLRGTWIGCFDVHFALARSCCCLALALSLGMLRWPIDFPPHRFLHEQAVGPEIRALRSLAARSCYLLLPLRPRSRDGP